MKYTLTLMTDHPSDVGELAKSFDGRLYAKPRMIRWRDQYGSHGYAQHTGDYVVHLPTLAAVKEFCTCFDVSCFGNRNYEVKDTESGEVILV